MEALPFIVGRHPAMRRVVDVTRRVAETDAIVLVTGESGTGKELVARAVHALSQRSAGPFIPANCAAIPAGLLESELFGHRRGAFTGAVGTRSGLFELANGGTIFLDEVAEMSSALQVKLLRVLQDGDVRQVGGEHAIHVDARVIAATNKDLTREVARGAFREDLFYRLQVVPIVVPPLRERRSDVRVLVDYFLEKLNRSRHERLVTITDDAMAVLWEYDWPGNVRELENLLERLVVLTDGATIDVEHVPSTIREYKSTRHVRGPTLGTHGIDLKRAVAEFEVDLIAQALRRTRGNKQAAARLLGLKRTTLVAKMDRREMPFDAEVYSDEMA
jgi:transcriptional regulator with PAS, ATPase and Fis domain